MADAATKFRQQVVELFRTILFPVSVRDVRERGLMGKLEEGIRTTMAIGDIDILGELIDTPVASNVEYAKKHYFTEERIQNTPKSLLLPTFMLTGKLDMDDAEENSQWKMIHEEDRTNAWAFLLVMIKKSQDRDADSDQSLYRKMYEAAKEVQVLLLSTQDTALWQEWRKAEDNSLSDTRFSIDRCTVRYKFMLKLGAALQMKNPGTKIQKKDMWFAFEKAEKEGLFSRGKTGSLNSKISELMKVWAFGEQLSAWNLMDEWRDLEVIAEGRTALYDARFAITFPGLVNSSEETATYVLGMLKRIYLDPKGNAQRTKNIAKYALHPIGLHLSSTKMKALVKTLALMHLWCKSLVQSCENYFIQAPQKTQVDFQLVKQAFDINLAENLVEDETGKKASLHPLSADLLNVCLSVLVDLEHYDAFSAAEALHMPFHHIHLCQTLQHVCFNVIDAWSIANVQYMTGAQQGDAIKARKEAVRKAAELAVKAYCPYYIRNGDPALDRENILNFPIAGTAGWNMQNILHKGTAQWNMQIQGNRRVTMYDEAGRRNPLWEYIEGRNPYLMQIGFASEDCNECIDTWNMMLTGRAAPTWFAPSRDVFSVWNVGQPGASEAITAKAATLTGISLKKTTLKGLQTHVERRLWSGFPPSSAEHHLEPGLPGVSEECFDLFAGPLPERKKHLYPGPLFFDDNFHPEEIIPLRNPAKSEPQVSITVKKQIFPPDFDQAAGSNCIHADEVAYII
jgi:hypothetical protein